MGSPSPGSVAPTQEGFWRGMPVVGKELGPDDPDFPSRLTVFCVSVLCMLSPFSKALSPSVVSTATQLETGNAGS